MGSVTKGNGWLHYTILSWGKPPKNP